MTNLPAFLQNYKRGAPSASLDSLTKISTGSQPYISIEGNRFRAIDAVGDEQMIGDIDRKTGLAYCDVVIIDANDHVSKVYYAGEYDPKAKEYTPPDCWSDNGVAPSSQAGKPQCRSCAECPHAAWGSDISKLTGKQTKACNDVKKIAVYVPELRMPFLMRVPPASLKDLGNYAKTLAANNANAALVVTRMEFKPDGVGMLTFKALEWINEKLVGEINDLDATKIDQLVNKNDVPRTGELPAPGQTKQITQQAGTSNQGTPAPKAPPQGMFGGDVRTVAVETRATTPEEIEMAAMRKRLAELEAAAAKPAEEDKPKRTRRTKEQIAADEAAAKVNTPPTTANTSSTGGMFSTSNETPQDAEEQMEVPSFLTGGRTGVTTTVSRAGGQKAEEPDEDLRAKLNAAFALNVGN